MKFTFRINDRCKKSSAGKSLRTTFDKKWQWLIIIEESSRDKRELREKQRIMKGMILLYFTFLN